MKSTLKCPECGKMVAVRFPMHDCKPEPTPLCQVFGKELTKDAEKHGFELRFSKGRKLKILSYALWFNGICVVDHATTRADEIAVGGIENRLEIERKNYPNLPII